MSSKEIMDGNIPKHVAIILDGNGRWAKKRGLPRNLGHRQGALNLKDIVQAANKIGIQVLTVYCFSTENWSRPKEEVDYLMTKPLAYYKKYRNKILESDVKVQFIGRRDRFSKEFLQTMEDVERITKDKKGITLVIAVDYGSHEEITSATRRIAQLVAEKKIQVEDINEELISNSLYTSKYPPLDLLIRTSGEIRISNFLLWQLAYSELYFTDVFWPDFDEKELYQAIFSFQSRKRRFGGLKE